MKNIKNNKFFTIIIFIVVLFIPLIYSFFYLKSYWDPYGDLSGMKIAVINLDTGKDGENQGNDFVSSLKESATFDIQEVSKEEAEQGMEKGTYYASIEIPDNFTECLLSASTTDKQIAQITYSPNQATNYLATQIVNSAVKTIELNLQSKIDKQIIANLASKLNEVPDSLEKISDGTDSILSGSKTLNSGLKQIKDGTSTLTNSYSEFNTGVQSAYSGSQSLESGISQVSSGVNTLQSGSKSLDSAISQINSGVDQLSAQGGQGINQLSAGISALDSGTKNLNDSIPTYVTATNTLNTMLNNLVAQCENSTDPNLQASAAQLKYVLNTKFSTLTASGEALKTGASTLYAGTQTLSNSASGLNQITQGIQNLKTALSSVKQGTSSLNSGVNTLSTGVNTLSAGSSSLTNGLAKLSSSSNQINDALNTINVGTSSAYNGSSSLVSGVQTFKTSVNEGLQETNEQLKSLDGIEEFGENPVNFETDAYGEVSSYGVAFTPLFLCIGLWVGALMCYVVLYYDHDNRFGVLGMTNKNKLFQNILYIALGALEGLLTGILLKLSLGYAVENVALYYGSSILIGITFMSIIQFLIRNFGDIGKFLALIVLVLQLAASGGTFPIETINKGFQVISPYLPMTYSIKLLREILVPTATNLRGSYILILLCISIITFAITTVVDIVKTKKTTNA